MLAKSYRINVNERTLPLIIFLNDGITPTAPAHIMKKDLWFLFTIDSPNEITVSRNSIMPEDDLYNADGTTKEEYYKYESLIG